MADLNSVSFASDEIVLLFVHHSFLCRHVKIPNRDLKIEVFRHSCEPRGSGSQVISALPSGLQFEVHICTARSRFRGK